jgi:hypothetical protein
VSPTGWAGFGPFAGRCAYFAPSPQQYITCAAGATGYAAGTAFTWIMAIRVFRTAAQRNLVFLGSTANNNNWRGLYMNSSHQIGVLNNRNGASPVAVTGTAPDDEQILLGITCDASGNMVVKQLTASGETTLMTDTIVMSGTLTVNQFSIGAAIINNAVSSYSSLTLRMFAGIQSSVTSARLSRLLVYMRDKLGCPLPPIETADIYKQVPTGLQRWFNASLQTSAAPTVDDLAPGNHDGLLFSGGVITSHEFDFVDSAAAGISSGGCIIPAGSSPFTLLFSVRRVAGRTWDTATNFNFISGISLGITSLVNGGLFKYHYDGTLYSSGYDVISNWAANKRHVGALVYNGSVLRSYIDDPNVFLAQHSVGERANPTELFMGHFNGGAAGSWEHKAKDYAVYDRALSPAELDQHWRMMNLNSSTLVFTGDSNIALIKQDGYAPPAQNSIYRQAQQYVFPRAGFRTRFGINDGVSGSMWDTPGALAPTPIISRGAALDAAVDGNEWNWLWEHSSTNDIHQALYGGDVEQVVTRVITYATARRASGKYVGIGGFQIPPSSNATFNGKIDTYNARMVDLRNDGTLDLLVLRDPVLADPADLTYWQIEAGASDPKHYMAPAAKLQAEALLSTMYASKYHD